MPIVLQERSLQERCLEGPEDQPIDPNPVQEMDHQIEDMEAEHVKPMDFIIDHKRKVCDVSRLQEEGVVRINPLGP
jgi:hypothetical protein